MEMLVHAVDGGGAVAEFGVEKENEGEREHDG